MYIGEIGYFVDSNSDGIYDTFYENSTGLQKDIQLTEDNEYLIDLSGDGNWDYIYNIETKTLNKISDLSESTSDDFSLFILVIVILLLFLLFLLTVGRIRTKKKELWKSTKIKEKHITQKQSTSTKKQSKSGKNKKSKK